MRIYLQAFAVLAAAAGLIYLVGPHFEGQVRGAVEMTAVFLATIGVFMPVAAVWQRPSL